MYHPKGINNRKLTMQFMVVVMVYNIKSRGLRWVDHVARLEESRSAFKILTGTYAGKRTLGRLRRGWEDNIRMYLKEIGVDRMNWIDSVQDRDYYRALATAALTLWVP